MRQFIHVSVPCDHVVTKYLNGSESKEILPAAQQPASLAWGCLLLHLIRSLELMEFSAPPTKLSKVPLSVFMYVCIHV